MMTQVLLKYFIFSSLFYCSIL